VISSKPIEWREVNYLIFITLSKWKQTPSKESMKRLDQATETFQELEKQGIKMRVYWTLGSYDGVTTETLVAVPREEALKLL
jgi:uncharacterized protein with GYD domain